MNNNNNNNNLSEDEAKSTPLENSKSALLALSAQSCHRNKTYASSKQVRELAIEVYKTKGGRGITYKDLLETGFAKHKKNAQYMLKYHVRTGTLFTLEDKRPQQYYLTAIKSKIIENKQKSTQIYPSGVTSSPTLPHISNSDLSRSKAPLASCFEPIINETLEGYILPLLPKVPSHIHNMHFKTTVLPECYAELDLPHYKRNYGKYVTEVIGNTRVDYVLYANGTVDIHTECSRYPHKLETEEDRTRLIAFFGQVRDRLVVLLCDKHERIVPDIMHWQLTECDINKDIKVSDLFHMTGIKIQLKHLDHLFRLYVKSMGKDTVFRVEESKHNNLGREKSAIEFINVIFNPEEKMKKIVDAMEQRLQKIDTLISNFSCVDV